MTMTRPWRIWKLWIAIALAILLMVDASLIVFLWRNGREGQQAMARQRDRLETEAKLLRADVARGEKIRASLPEAGKECDAFYRERLLSSATGYSTIEADMDEIAAKAGLRTSGIAFSQKELKGRGVTTITVKATVEGDYPAIIQFINGLERSKNFYLLNDLTLASETTGGIRVNLELNTYFRT
jgi:Tfp pilus assembly protein PilO